MQKSFLPNSLQEQTFNFAANFLSILTSHFFIKILVYLLFKIQTERVKCSPFLTFY